LPDTFSGIYLQQLASSLLEPLRCVNASAARGAASVNIDLIGIESGVVSVPAGVSPIPDNLQLVRTQFRRFGCPRATQGRNPSGIETRTELWIIA
jgi:hypothetical protein